MDKYIGFDREGKKTSTASRRKKQIDSTEMTSVYETPNYNDRIRARHQTAPPSAGHIPKVHIANRESNANEQTHQRSAPLPERSSSFTHLTQCAIRSAQRATREFVIRHSLLAPMASAGLRYWIFLT